MWLKQCHKPPIWEWFIPPIYGEIGDGLFLFYPRYSIANRNWGWLCFLYFMFFSWYSRLFCKKKCWRLEKINQFPLGQLAPIRNDTQVFQNWFEETLWGKSDMGLFDFSSDIKMWWFITIFWKKLPCWGMPPLDKRNVFGLQKKYGSCSRSLNPVNVPFIFFSEIYGRMKNLWKYEMALAVRLGTMCRCSLGWSIVISVISIVYSESRLSHK